MNRKIWYIASQSEGFIFNNSVSLQSENRKKTSPSCHMEKAKLAVTNQIQFVDVCDLALHDIHPRRVLSLLCFSWHP